MFSSRLPCLKHRIFLWVAKQIHVSMWASPTSLSHWRVHFLPRCAQSHKSKFGSQIWGYLKFQVTSRLGKDLPMSTSSPPRTASDDLVLVFLLLLVLMPSCWFFAFFLYLALGLPSGHSQECAGHTPHDAPKNHSWWYSGLVLRTDLGSVSCNAEHSNSLCYSVEFCFSILFRNNWEIKLIANKHKAYP